MEQPPGPDTFVRFLVDGVKLRDIEQYDELCARLISPREEPNKVRKDGFYFSLFLLRLLDDITSRQRETLRVEMREMLREELARQRAPSADVTFASLEGDNGNFHV
jgi:hypothetical protein